jgi:DtxR family Mn-dependent transcriptional regulator
MYSFTEENYLKSIFKLSEQEHQDNISTNSIADALQTKAASVTDMIKKLSDKKLLKYEKYKGVTLTEKGRRVAVDTVRKHRLWECFLYDKLKFGWDEVHEIAEQLEHIKSELLIDKLDEFLDYPTHDPHGDPIPTKTGVVKKTNFVLLADAPEKTTLVMSGVVDHTPVFLQYLNRLNLALGSSFKMDEKIAYDGSVVVIYEGKSIHLSKEVTKNILVKVK